MLNISNKDNYKVIILLFKDNIKRKKIQWKQLINNYNKIAFCNNM